jgi:hypothetical protein
MAEQRSVATTEPSRAGLEALRRLLDQAFGGRFGEDGWRHTGDLDLARSLVCDWREGDVW